MLSLLADVLEALLVAVISLLNSIFTVAIVWIGSCIFHTQMPRYVWLFVGLGAFVMDLINKAYYEVYDDEEE